MLENYFWMLLCKIPADWRSFISSWYLVSLWTGFRRYDERGSWWPSSFWQLTSKGWFSPISVTAAWASSIFWQYLEERNSVSDFYTTKVTQLYCTSLPVWRAHPLRVEACYRNTFAVISNIKSIKLTDSKFWAFVGCYQEMFLRDGQAWEMVKIWWR